MTSWTLSDWSNLGQAVGGFAAAIGLLSFLVGWLRNKKAQETARATEKQRANREREKADRFEKFQRTESLMAGLRRDFIAHLNGRISIISELSQTKPFERARRDALSVHLMRTNATFAFILSQAIESLEVMQVKDRGKAEVSFFSEIYRDITRQDIDLIKYFQEQALAASMFLEKKRPSSPEEAERMMYEEGHEFLMDMFRQSMPLMFSTVAEIDALNERLKILVPSYNKFFSGGRGD